MHTGRELSGSRGELDPDALRRIETEIVTIGQIIKTQFGEGSSRGDLSHRSMSEDAARIAQLEVEKKELETKLKLAREAMNEYVTRLNDKVGTLLYLHYGPHSDSKPALYSKSTDKIALKF